MICLIQNKRFSPNPNGTHICETECPICGHSLTVSYGGWSAYVCPGCKIMLYRNKSTYKAQLTTKEEA